MAIQATLDVIRAWTDEEYRRTLSPDDRVHLPTHPAGDIALLDAAIQAICGTDPKRDEYMGTGITYNVTIGVCCYTETIFCNIDDVRN